MEDRDKTKGRLRSKFAALCRRDSEPEGTEVADQSTEEALRQQLSLLQAVIDAIPGAVFYKDTEGRYLGCNKAFESTFGFSRTDIIGKTSYDVAPPDLAETYSRADAETLREPGVLRYETAIRDASGVHHDVILQKSLFSDVTGKIAGIVGIGIDITEQKQTEKALREAEDKFRDVADKSLAGIYLMQDGLIKYANRRFAEIHGYTVEELKGMGPEETILPEDLPLVKDNLRRRLSGEVESLHFEFRILTKQQETRYVEVYGSFTVYEGKPAVIGTLLDITERKKDEEALQRYREHLEELVKERTAALEREISERTRTEKALRESEEKYRTIFENATEGISQTTPEGRCLSVNPAFARMFGYDSPEEAMADLTDIGHQVYSNPTERERFVQLLADRGEVEAYDAEAVRKDGEKIWISINAHVVRDEHGAIHHYEGTHQDITERKTIEMRLKESEERYRIAIENSNDGVAIARGGRHLYVNQKFLEMFGYDGSEDIVGDTTRKDVHPDDRQRVLEYSRKRLRGEPAPTRYEFKGIKKDGTVIFVEASVAVIVYHGEPASLAYLRDVTERKQMEEKLESMSIGDELTGLYNRRGFFTLCEQQLKLAGRTKKGMELFFMDLDKMKWINDTLGHKEGDAALIEVAAILRETFRESDIIGRMGGDEFAILAINATDEHREDLVRRLQSIVDRNNTREARKYRLSLSVGMAAYDPKNPVSLEELIIRADTLMYEEKRSKQHRI